MKLINGKEMDLLIYSEAAKKHFEAENNYTAFILQEWEGLPYSKYIKPGSVILDIGANVGLFALHVLPYVKKVVCVEPTPGHMQIQKELLKDNHTGSSAIVAHEQAALNYYTGKAKFRNEPVNTTMNTLRESPDAYDVDCITLKNLCEKHSLASVDFCKVDIEGSEWQALIVERIKEVSGIINFFFVELHPRSLESQVNMGERFEAAGYKVDMVDYNGSIIAYR